MKKILVVIIALTALLIVSDFIYKKYKRAERRTTLTDDRAVLFTYINLNPGDVKSYFSLSDSAYQHIKDNYSIVCDVAQYHNLNLINNRTNIAAENINCNEAFKFDSQFEMKREFQPTAYQLRVKLAEKSSGKMVAYKYIYVPWDYGKVNHIIVEKDSAYKCCRK